MEIFYTPNLDFEAFDLQLELEGKGDTFKRMINYKEAICLFEKVGLPYAQILAEGTMNELIQKLDPETFESTIYLKHNLPKVPNNFAEGYVIKPIEPIYKVVKRLIIKLKHSRFSEKGAVGIKKVKNQNKDKDKKNPEQPTDEEQSIIDIALAYVTRTRLENSLTKLDDDKRSDCNIGSGFLV